MADESQQAARVGDIVQHTQAKTFRRAGAVLGAVLGVGILLGVGIIDTALEVGSAGLLTPVVAGFTLVVVGSLAGAVSAFSSLGAWVGKHFTEDDGFITSGAHNVRVGRDNMPLAHVYSNVSCKQHKHKDGPIDPNSPDVLDAAQEQISQGSATVKVGPARWEVARIGSIGTCECRVGSGWPNVYIGGATATIGPIDEEGDDPERGFFNMIGFGGAVAAIIGVGILGGVAVAAQTLVIGGGISLVVNMLPSGLREVVGAGLSLVPLATMPKFISGLRGPLPNEGLTRGGDETEEAFSDRVKQAKIDRVEAEWENIKQSGKMQTGQIPTDRFGRPIPAYETVPSGEGVPSTRGGTGTEQPPGPPVYQMSSGSGTGSGSSGSGTGGSANVPLTDAELSKTGDPAATLRNNQAQSAAVRAKEPQSAHGYDIENKIITEKGADVVKAGEDVSYKNSAGVVKSTDIDVETKTEVIQIKSGTGMPSPGQMEATQLHAAAVGKPVRVIYDANKVPGAAVRDFQSRNPSVILEPRTDF